MLTSAVFFVCCLLVDGLPLPAADLSQQLLAVRQLVEGKKYAEAIVAYEQFLQQAPKSLQGAVQCEIAALHAVLGNTDRSLAMTEQAIQSGFDDCSAIRQREELKAVKSDPAFKELYSRIRVSEADLKELYWLKAEIENVRHDTKMMITENINRVDSGITIVTPSAIPIPRIPTTIGRGCRATARRNCAAFQGHPATGLSRSTFASKGIRNKHPRRPTGAKLLA